MIFRSQDWVIGVLIATEFQLLLGFSVDGARKCMYTHTCILKTISHTTAHFPTEVLLTPVLGHLLHGCFPHPTRTRMLHTGWSSCADPPHPAQALILPTGQSSYVLTFSPHLRCLAATAPSLPKCLPSLAWGQTPSSGPPWLPPWPQVMALGLNCLGRERGRANFFLEVYFTLSVSSRIPSTDL